MYYSTIQSVTMFVMLVWIFIQIPLDVFFFTAWLFLYLFQGLIVSLFNLHSSKLLNVDKLGCVPVPKSCGLRFIIPLKYLQIVSTELRIHDCFWCILFTVDRITETVKASQLSQWNKYVMTGYWVTDVTFLQWFIPRCWSCLCVLTSRELGDHSVCNLT